MYESQARAALKIGRQRNKYYAFAVLAAATVAQDCTGGSCAGGSTGL
jgi:hypothetical protein